MLWSDKAILRAAGWHGHSFPVLFCTRSPFKNNSGSLQLTPPSEKDAQPASITGSCHAGHSPQRAFIFPCPPRCDTALNLEAKVLGEFQLKVAPNQTARESFLKLQEMQKTVSKGQEPHLYPPPYIYIFFSFQALSYLWSAFSYSLWNSPKFQGTGLGISKVNVFNGFL